MDYTLRRPCAHCPFRSDIHPYLGEARAREIGETILFNDATFSCHEHNIWDEDEEGNAFVSEEKYHCAGAMIFLEKQDRPNQMMRIAERIGIYDRSKLSMGAPVCGTLEEFIEQHSEGRRYDPEA